MREWKYDVRDKLSDYPKQKNAVETLPDEIRRLQSEYTSLHATIYDDTPVQGGARRMRIGCCTTSSCAGTLSASCSAPAWPWSSWRPR